MDVASENLQITMTGVIAKSGPATRQQFHQFTGSSLQQFDMNTSWFADTERELVLIKVRVPPGPARAEVMQLVDVFRARVVDVSEKTLTLAVTGDAGKVSHARRQTECAELPVIVCATVQGMIECTTVQVITSSVLAQVMLSYN